VFVVTCKYVARIQDKDSLALQHPQHNGKKKQQALAG
jgi:hypothetical protein